MDQTKFKEAIKSYHQNFTKRDGGNKKEVEEKINTSEKCFKNALIAQEVIRRMKKLSTDRLENQQTKHKTPSLGVIRLDYDYPCAAGDIDCPKSFDYDVYYKVVPGLTFEVCQSGKLTDEVRERFIKSIEWLVAEKHVSAITGDCGFMMYFQHIARELHVPIPVFMSPLCQLPSVLCAFGSNEQIIILTANRKSLESMHCLIKKECGINCKQKRFHIVGCEDVDGFEAVAYGEKVDTKKVEPGIVKKAKDALQMYPESRAFLLECTELPPYSDAIRLETGLPVFDTITGCNAIIDAFRDNARFGKIGWQQKWSGKQKEEYHFGQELLEEEMKALVSKMHPRNRFRKAILTVQRALEHERNQTNK